MKLALSFMKQKSRVKYSERTDKFSTRWDLNLDSLAMLAKTIATFISMQLLSFFLKQFYVRGLGP
jgi:uncharacterized membrane protein